MKIALALCLCLLPLCYGNFIGQFLDKAEITHLVDTLVEQFGTDATEHQCEEECRKLFKNPLIMLTCPFDCKNVQSLVQKLHSHPKPTDAP